MDRDQRAHPLMLPALTLKHSKGPNEKPIQLYMQAGHQRNTETVMSCNSGALLELFAPNGSVTIDLPHLFCPLPTNE